jgi:hypothetical protein
LGLVIFNLIIAWFGCSNSYDFVSWKTTSEETLRIVIVNQKLHEFVILLLFSVFLNWKALL